MKKIVIKTEQPQLSDFLTLMLKQLFPECEIETSGRGGEAGKPSDFASMNMPMEYKIKGGVNGKNFSNG